MHESLTNYCVLLLDPIRQSREAFVKAEGRRILSCLANRHALQRARLMVVVAHPDDEVIGAGARLSDLTSAFFVHVTTGTTSDCDGNYEPQRGVELVAALKMAGLSCRQLRPLGLPDQALTGSLVDLTRRLSSLIAAERPAAILTHPYEGGHPDHDAIAFAVHAACRALPNSPPVIEMAFYHQGTHGIRTGEFLPDGDTPQVRFPLSETQRDFKRRLLNCFTSQAETLGYFTLDMEQFRLAPHYNFTEPPHVGRLFYENFNWGIRSGAEWRGLAREALLELHAG